MVTKSKKGRKKNKFAYFLGRNICAYSGFIAAVVLIGAVLKPPAKLFAPIVIAWGILLTIFKLVTTEGMIDG